MTAKLIWVKSPWAKSKLDSQSVGFEPKPGLVLGGTFTVFEDRAKHPGAVAITIDFGDWARKGADLVLRTYYLDQKQADTIKKNDRDSEFAFSCSLVS